MTQSRLTLTLTFLPLLLAWPNFVHAEALVMNIEGMTCAPCRDKVVAVLTPLDFVRKVSTSLTEKEICVETTGQHNRDEIDKAIESLAYRVEMFRTALECPEQLGQKNHSWAGKMEGRDVVEISKGEEIDLPSHLVPGKFTIVDFGAPWCAPCYLAAEQLMEYLDRHSDVAVRVVSLESEDANASYALPIAQQHLQYAPGIPWFLVYAPDGKRLYQGLNLEKALKLVSKKRAKLK